MTQTLISLKRTQPTKPALRSAAGKEHEYELGFEDGDAQLVMAYKEILRNNNIRYRQVGLEVFYPPGPMLIGRSSIMDALLSLLTLHETLDPVSIGVKIVTSDGLVVHLRDQRAIEGLIQKMSDMKP